jgi:hypothetical protein
MTHAHFWIVGPRIKGVCPSRCKICGESREFRDYVPLNFNRNPERQDVYVQRLQMKRPAASAAWYEEH